MELVIGRVAKAHGVRGEVVVDVRTDDPDDRFAVGTVLAARTRGSSALMPYRVEAAREHSGRLLLVLEGITDKSAADALRGSLFVIDTADLPESDDPDEFYDHELEGMTVRFADCHPRAGESVGVVREVLHSAAGELLSIRAEDDREILVPFVAAIVTGVDRATATVDIDPPNGLLDA